jgi:hypothetical protein
MLERFTTCGEESDEGKKELLLVAGEVQMRRAKHTDRSADTGHRTEHRPETAKEE